MKATKEMTIEQVLELDQQGIAPILMESGMHCLGCAMASGETLEQACAAHNIETDDLIAAINAYLAKQG